jgi:parvulin-like peptidyl-prolyl isomerase
MGNVTQMLKATGMTMSDLRSTVFAQQAGLNIIMKICKVTDKEIRQEYDKNKNTTFTKPESAQMAGIICNTKDKATKAYDQVKKGKDFSAVSKEMSDEEFVRKNGGRLGRLYRGQQGLPEQISKTAFSLKPNAISAPFYVKMQGQPDQWVVLKVMDRTPKTTMSFDSVKVRIKEELLIKKGDGVLQTMVKKARKSARIVVVASKYKKLEKQLQKPK